MPSRQTAPGKQSKTLVDHGAGRLLLRALCFAPGTSVYRHAHSELQAALILEGGAVVDDVTPGVWDLIYRPANVAHDRIRFPHGATLLAVTVRCGKPV